VKNSPSIITHTDSFSVSELEEFARRIEGLGYDSLWVTEFTGRDPYTTAAHILVRTEHITIATGIANVYSHDAVVGSRKKKAPFRYHR
jgi:alkanesulfonate monooxygenase SsuD/methylene tetrahydromethanopterin reductase-like flavin-dependent oxidoreductase (luciferase family)